MQLLVLDTGVLLAYFNQKDHSHAQALRGFRQLAREGTRLVVSSSVVLETAKRMLFDVSPVAMRVATEIMFETLEIVDTTKPSIQNALDLIMRLNHRTISLEDAVVINLALTFNAPVWTYNYRDFGGIKNLEFWTPA
ncbi:MAG: type II toxin-antitoxin system VapC family toxin [Deinococcales bacterium]